jgi:hypothetical protein
MKSGMPKKYFFHLIILPLLLLTLLNGCQRASDTPLPGTDLPQATEPSTSEPVLTEGTAQISTLLFRDDFQDGDSAGWVINTGWKVQQNEENYFFGTTVTGGTYVKNGAGWSDYAYHSSVWVKQGVLLISINLSSESRYVLRLGGDGVYLIREKPKGSYVVLAEAGPITLSKWTWVTFASQQGHLQVYLDRVLWFDVVDPEPILNGTISVGAQEDSRVAVDNILVNRVSVLAAGEPQAPAPLTSEPLDTSELQAVADVLPAEEVETETVEVAADLPPVPNGTPDLIIMPLTTMPYPVFRGTQFEADFAVGNNGNASSGAFDVLIHFHALANIEDCRMAVPDLAPGEIAMGACQRTITGNTGNYPVELTADIAAVVAESDEDNNFLVNTLVVIDYPFPSETLEPETSLPDIEAVSISYEDELNGISRYRCSATTTGQDFLPPIYYQISRNGTVFYEAAYPAIPAGQPSYLLFPVDTVPPFTLTCTLDANNSIPESNEANNSISVQFP